MTNNEARAAFFNQNIEFWNSIASQEDKSWSNYYRSYIQRVYRYIVPDGSRVLEIGCGKGDLLAALNPSEGVGIDLSPQMVEQAQSRFPHLIFKSGMGEEVDLGGPFEFIILSDLLNGMWDIQEFLYHLSGACSQDTRIVINAYSRLWQPMLNTVRRLGLATPNLPQSWLTVKDIENLLALEGYEPVKNSSEMIFPLKIPLLSSLLNRYLAKIFPFRHLCLSNFIVARKLPEYTESRKQPTVSVIVAARNEEGNIHDIFQRTPDMGGGTELIFVEGGSSDNTWSKIAEEIKSHPEKVVYAYQQTGVGKGDAVRLGFSKATGDILMILDADMTVPPENLPDFFRALVESKGEFINGVRLVYPMEGEAMRFWNLVGNKFFSVTFSWLLGQSIKDTLCGTKVLTRQNYSKIATNRHYFGEFDPFGDFDLIFGAAKQNLKIVDLPIRYRNRLYGETNISRWRHGVILLKMVIFAARKIKFF
jgi:SAM-dependent methyltransferase